MAARDANDQRLEERILEAKGYVVVAFMLPESLPCRHFKPEYEAFAGLMQGDFEFWRVDAGENPGIATEFKIVPVPTVLVFRDGDEIARFEGPYSREGLKRRMDAVLMRRKNP